MGHQRTHETVYFDIETYDPTGKYRGGPWFHYGVIYSESKGYQRFESVSEFWDELVSQDHSRPEHMKIIVAHNGLGYDMPILAALIRKIDPEWITNADKADVRQSRRIHRYGKHTWEIYKDSYTADGTPLAPVIAVDSRQKLNGTLATWGEVVGIAKGETPICHERVPVAEEMWEYCETDVRILKEAYERIGGPQLDYEGIVTAAGMSRSEIKKKRGTYKKRGMQARRKAPTEAMMPPKYYEACERAFKGHMNRCHELYPDYDSTHRASERRKAWNFIKKRAFENVSAEGQKLMEKKSTGQKLSASDEKRWQQLTPPKIVKQIPEKCFMPHEEPTGDQAERLRERREKKERDAEFVRLQALARQASRGGITRPFNMRDEYSLEYPRVCGEGYVYDVNSMYPYILTHYPINSIPMGEYIGRDPREFDKRNPNSDWEWIARIKLKAKLKPRRHSMLKLGTGMSTILRRKYKSSDAADYYLNELNWGGEEYNITSVEYYGILEKDWDIESIEFISVIFFAPDYEDMKAVRGFLKEQFEIKTGSEKNSGPYLRSKLLQNNVWGRWLMNHKIVMQEGELVDIGDPKAPCSAAVFTTARARVMMADVARAFYEEIRYGDTDSAHLEGVPPEKFKEAGFDVDPYKLGAWDCETHFSSARYLKPKIYCLEIPDGESMAYKFTTAGSSFREEDTPTPAELEFGWGAPVLQQVELPDERITLQTRIKRLNDPGHRHYD